MSTASAGVPASAGVKFRAALAAESPLQVIGAINANHALLARRAGYRAVYLSGGGVAAGSLGLPLCTPELAQAATLCTRTTSTGVMWQTIIHCVFILSAVGIAYTDRLMTQAASKREHATH